MLNLDKPAFSISKPFSGLCWFMVGIMSSPREEDKVLPAIVRPNAIDMVNNIIERKRPPNVIINDKPMFKNSAFCIRKNMPRHVDFNVPVRSKTFPANSISFICKCFTAPPTWVPIFAFSAFVRAIFLSFMAGSKALGAFFTDFFVIHRIHCSINPQSYSVPVIGISPRKHFRYFHEAILFKGGILVKC